MKWITNITSYFKSSSIQQESNTSSASAANAKQPIINSQKNSENPNEIKMAKDLSDEQIQRQQNRDVYIKEVPNPPHVVVKGDNISKIAEKYGVEVRSILVLNNIKEADKDKLSLGQELKIPPKKVIVKNINNYSDAAKALGVSDDFIKRIKKIEDGGKLKENEFHLTPYRDDNGVLTIGIGHVVKNGKPSSLKDSQAVLTLFVEDMLKMEDNLRAIIGKDKYDSLPTPIKEALLDMIFNKGSDIITEKSPGLVYCLREGKYEAAINKMNYNKTMSLKENKPMSGLCKRRLMDIAQACKIYDGKIPQSNIDTIQRLYDEGYQLLKDTSPNFENVLVGYNKEIQGYFADLEKKTGQKIVKIKVK